MLGVIILVKVAGLCNPMTCGLGEGRHRHVGRGLLGRLDLGTFRLDIRLEGIISRGGSFQSDFKA